MSKEASIEEIATRFVNLNAANDDLLVTPAVTDFIREYQRDLHLDVTSNNEKAVAVRSQQLRKAWSKSDPEFVEKQLEDIFSDYRSDLWDEARRGLVPGESLRTASTDRYTSNKRPAFKVRLGHSKPVFEPRDLLDRIAFAILKASERGLLRKCRGHQRGWQCPMPFLVADEKRRVYCYSRCGDEAKSRAKYKWWKQNLSASARKSKRQ
jgi:hypothetical protein